VQAGHTGTDLIDDSHDVVSGGERQRPLIVRIAAAPNEDVREAGAGGQDLDADLVGTGVGDSRFSVSSITSGPPNREIEIFCQVILSP
jgi:hypothetical protein